jgi:hypothetical protein
MENKVYYCRNKGANEQSKKGRLHRWTSGGVKYLPEKEPAYSKHPYKKRKKERNHT